VAELPSGTVTFLFTDIERSTESAAALGDERWADVLEDHRRIIRAAFKAHEGHEVGTEGDSFFVAFERAHDAVAAATQTQRGLAAHKWPGESSLSVRIGIHTGEVLQRGDGYVGHEVHRAKRISDAAHGGQILLSQTTADLVGTSSLADLGSHRLKDLGEPQRIFQVVDEGLETGFPPLRSLDAFTHSLPLQRSAFIGRDGEIAEIRKMLESNRIVTLTGVGGCGKTRLAQQIGAEELDHFPDGVFFVNLAPISDPDLVVREIATSVGVPLGGGMGGLGGTIAGPVEEALLGYLRSRACLLILDNCEHLIDVCADIADRILAHAPQLSLLATSREGLRVEGEQSWTVPSLSVPSEGTDAQSSESVSLFKARAKAVRPSFDLTPENLGAVVEICRRLDGIPLAIEFAAARVSHLSPRQIAERLDDRFRLLTGGQRRVQRQNTLQATLDWSFDLLDDEEKTLLRRLSVFAGDFAIDAAEGICSDDGLPASRVTDLIGSLVSKSLVEADLSTDDVRYRLLETVRAYAAERLTHAGEAERFRTLHRDWYMELLLATPREEAWTSLAYTHLLWREESNLAAAMEWSVAEGRPDVIARMGTRMFNGVSGSGAEGARRWLDIALEAEDELDPDDRVWCLLGARGPLTDGLDATIRSTERAVAAADRASPAVATFALSARATINGVVAAMSRNDELADRAYQDFDEAMQRAGGDLGSQGWILFNRAVIDLSLANIEAGETTLAEGLRVANAAGRPFMASGFALYISIVRHVMGDDAGAAEAAELASRGMDRMIGLDRLAAGEGLERFPRGFAAPGAAIGAVTEGTESQWSFLRAYRPYALRAGVPAFEADLVLAAAILWFYDGDHERAAKLLSWVRAHTMGAGAVPTPGDYVLYLHYRDRAREALGSDEARRARGEGESLSLEAALDLAFAEKVHA